MLERPVNRGELQIIKETIAIPILGKNKAGLDTPLATVSHNNMTRQGPDRRRKPLSVVYSGTSIQVSGDTLMGPRQESSNPPSEEVTDRKNMWTFFQTNFFDP